MSNHSEAARLARIADVLDRAREAVTAAPDELDALLEEAARETARGTHAPESGLEDVAARVADSYSALVEALRAEMVRVGRLLAATAMERAATAGYARRSTTTVVSRLDRVG